MARSIAHWPSRGSFSHPWCWASARYRLSMVSLALATVSCGGAEATTSPPPGLPEVPSSGSHGAGCSPLLPLNACEAEQSGQAVIIDIHSLNGTNDGGVLHILVRKTTAVNFQKEDYAAIVETLSATDSNTVCWRRMLPGTRQVFAVPRPTDDSALGIYFLFTRPGRSWKQLVPGSRRCARFALSGDEARYRSSPRPSSSGSEHSAGSHRSATGAMSISPMAAEGE